MKLFTVPRISMRTFQKVAVACSVACALAPLAQATVVDLGAASQFSVLSFNSSNVSDSSFSGGSIGVVNGNWTQSGGGQTNLQPATTVYLSPGHSNGGPAVESTVFNAPLLNQAWSDATKASSNLAALQGTASLAGITSITSAGSLNLTQAGNYVLNLSSINLNQAAYTISAPAGSTVVLNISGSITLNGGSQGNGLRLAGGLTSNNVVYNVLGGNSVNTTGGGNANVIQGIILDTAGSVNLHPGGVDGQVITQTFTSSSGAAVAGMVVVPETNSAFVLGPLLGLIFLFSGKRGTFIRSFFSRDGALV